MYPKIVSLYYQYAGISIAAVFLLGIILTIGWKWRQGKITKESIKTWRKMVVWKYVRLGDLSILTVSLLLSHWAYILLTWLYPNTGEPSFQWIYWTLFGVTRAVIIVGAGYLLLRIMLPKTFLYLENRSRKELNDVTPWQRIVYNTFLYCFFIVVVLISVITLGQ